jgi:sugar lactone lactonase YvrE
VPYLWRFEMSRNQGMKRLIQRAAEVIALPGILALLPPMAVASSSYVPPVVVSSASTVATTGLGIYQTDVAIDACGNFYTVQSGAIYYPDSAVSGGQVTEIPAGGGAATVILAAEGPSYDSNSLWMDATKSNLYVTEGANSTDVPDPVFRIPIVNCVPQAASKTAISIKNLGVIDYYFSASAVATDAAGDVFIATNVACCANVNELLEEDSSDSTGTVLLPNLSKPITSMTVDASNNIYYVSDGALYELAYTAGAYASTPVSYGGSYQTAVGVSLDGQGNLYVADSGTSTITGSSAIYEIPKEGASGLNPNDRFIVAAGIDISGPVAADSTGNLYYTYVYSTDAGASIQKLALGSANIGSATVGGSTTFVLNAVFNASVTPASISYFPTGGVFSSAKASTCVANAAYAAADTCTVTVSFNPALPGAAQGALLLADATGAALSSTYLAGAGLGAGVTIDPGAVTAIGSGLKTPKSVALDAAGNQFIADAGNDTVWEIAAGGGNPVAIGSSLSVPDGVAVDSVGNVYIADTGNSRIVEVPVVKGALSTATQTVLVSSSTKVSGGALNKPAGVSVDAQGNLYIADTVNSRIVFLPRGNNFQALTFNTPYAAATGDTGAFTLSSSESDACVSGGSVAVGAGCALQATFTPSSPGIYSETLVLSSNAANASAPQVVFTGTGQVTVATATSLKIISPSGAPYYGEAITMQATVTSSGGTPTGQVALLVDGIQSSAATLANGEAAFSLPNGLSGGSHTLQASYQGGAVGEVIYSHSESPLDTINVSKVDTVTQLSFATIYNNPPSQSALSPLTLTATVTSAHTGILSGAVDFTITLSSGASSIGKASLAAAGGGVFQASYVYTPTAPATGVAYDVVSVTASYEGDGNFSASVSANLSFDVAPAAGALAISASGASLPSSQSTDSSITFTHTSYGGWQGVVGYQCLASSLPANSICVFSPGQVTVQASTASAPYPLATTKLKVLINNPPNSPEESGFLWWLGAITGFLLLWVRRRALRGVWGTIAMTAGMLLLAVSGCGMLACNSGGVQYATPAGTSTITVIANADPFVSGATSTTQACGTEKTAENALAPCSKNTYQITLTVK